MNIFVDGHGYNGYVVVDSVVHNKSSGGVRIAADLKLDEVKELAHEMTLKYALFRLQRGGAKAGVCLSDELDREGRLRSLRDFGRKLRPLIQCGLYNPGMDLNCGPDDLRAIYSGAGIKLGEITDTSWFTAMSVHHAIRGCAEALGISRRPLTLVIDGFGSVAAHLARRLNPEEYRIAGIGTIEGATLSHESFEPAHLAQLKDRFGDRLVGQLQGEHVDQETLLTSMADVLVPSSRTWVITREMSKKVQARAVVPIANAPYAPGTVQTLHEKGILCMPGYISNVGGVMASSLFDQGVDNRFMEVLFETHYRAFVDALLRLAQLRGQSVVECARSLAQAHLTEQERHRSRSLSQKFYTRVVKRRLPRWLLARRARNAALKRFSILQGEISQVDCTS